MMFDVDVFLVSKYNAVAFSFCGETSSNTSRLLSRKPFDHIVRAALEAQFCGREALGAWAAEQKGSSGTTFRPE
jgi:hypothetical protein